MSMLDRVTKNTTSKPPIILAFGVSGIGKTTLGASAPKPIFLQTEDGLSSLEASTFGILKTFDEVLQAIGELYSEKHDFQTAVLDSVDHFEPLVWAQTCKDNGWKTIEDEKFSRGYAAALDQWRLVLDGLRALRDDRNMTVVMLAHSTIIKYAAPDADPYDRYVPKLHKWASALVMETTDATLFANYRTSTIKTETGFKKSVVRGIGSGERVLYTEERPSFVAKQRYNLPDSIPLSWDALAEHIPYFAGTAKPQTDKEAA